MPHWTPNAKDLKKYPHFDAHVSLKKIESIANDPEQVAKRAFFPFIKYTQQWQPYRKKPIKPEKKKRDIRYASRIDAAIFARYRALLSELHELELEQQGLTHVAIAYRKIPTGTSSDKGKCNIHFAKDAFDYISNSDNCCAISLDISSYFESIDHTKIKEKWMRLLNVSRLPDDHYAVFKAITKYSIVEKEKLYERLGYLKTEKTKSGGTKNAYTTAFSKMPTQLSKPADFRRYVAGDDPAYPSLIKKNQDNYGIPQGAPLSDIIANFYLLDFDKTINELVSKIGGYYVRYSDDILIIVPCDESKAETYRDFVMNEISNHGDELKIKPEKTGIVKFRKLSYGHEFKHISGAQGRNGLEFLGFRFNGSKVYLKDSTMSRFHRKMVFGVRREAEAQARRYPGKGVEFILEQMNFDDISQRYGRVEDFHHKRDYRDWTFWTYAKRASHQFGDLGDPILRQVIGYRRKLRDLSRAEVTKAVTRRINRLGA